MDHYEYARRRELASDRAKELLLSFLSESQRRTWEYSGYFIEWRGRRRYRFNRFGSVRRGDFVLCIQPDYRHGVLPEDDAILSKLLLLRANEPKFLLIGGWRQYGEPLLLFCLIFSIAILIAGIIIT